MSDVVKRDLYGLIDKELEAANQKFPLFNSTHEAFAVILEEAEEAKEEAGNLDILMNNFWIGVKENHDPEVLHEELTGIYKTALDLAVEAIQTAAMARKGIISSIDPVSYTHLDVYKRQDYGHGIAVYRGDAPAGRPYS